MKTEIFGTFGPACREEKIIAEMIEAGMTGMRLNLSHTTLPDSEGYIRAYQNAAGKAGVKQQLLIDMQGPELRVKSIGAPIVMQDGERLEIDNDVIPEIIIHVVEIGDEILLDDGKILVEVLEKKDETLDVKVIRGGTLHSHKSVKIVGKNVKMPVLTDHDIANIKVAKAYGITALMQPFVLSGEDLRFVRQVLKENGADDIKIFAKIENQMGVRNIESILPEADVIVIARGDLGNDMPLWELPRVQKELEVACHKAGKPYIVVTQMLASMETNPVPTRAEVSDIFHAVFHGAWGVMVTGETAVGRYPVESIRYLVKTAEQGESFLQQNKVELSWKK